jgi:hypothetical protein
MSSDKNLTGFENLSGLGQNIYLNSYKIELQLGFHAVEAGNIVTRHYQGKSFNAARRIRF